MKVVTCISPVNIAVIKYWGKRDEKLILPLNDSLSGTLSTEFMCAKTTIMADPSFESNTFWLNGEEQSFENERLENCLAEVRRRANPMLPQLMWNIRICSVNNFPTAAGLASSAAGYACLVSALAKLYEIKGDISGIARRGSGSACRSIYGGWVQWCRGKKDDGSDSVARQIAPASYWPEMRVLILVVNDERKKYSSTSGMKKSVETSTLLKDRAANVVPNRIQEIITAIHEKNFEKFGETTMRDSNQFHAICLDTYPPCVYMNDVSHAIVDLVHAYNKFKLSVKVAYTFDAGPNACIYLLESEVNEFISVVNYVFPPSENDLEHYFKGIPVKLGLPKKHLQSIFVQKEQNVGLLKYIIHTKIGDGPQVLHNNNDHLLNELGMPKKPTVNG